MLTNNHIQILAVNSPVFKAMFYGGFDEQSKKEIELKDVYCEVRKFYK